MAMGLYRGVNNVARKVVEQYRGINNVARRIREEYRGINNVARQIYGSELYLIRDGEYEVDFQNTSVWSYYPITNSSTKFSVTDEEEYIQIYNEGFFMGGIITTDAIDLSRYSKMNIEAEVLLDIEGTTARNRAAIGAYDSAADAVGAGTGSAWAAGEGTIFYKDIYTGIDTGGVSVPVSQSYDISSSELGHIFAYVTSYNYGSDYSYLRIKNLWLE